jgi:hypothetical protein
MLRWGGRRAASRGRRRYTCKAADMKGPNKMPADLQPFAELPL